MLGINRSVHPEVFTSPVDQVLCRTCNASPVCQAVLAKCGGFPATVNWKSLSSPLATEKSILPGTPVWKTSKASGVAQS